MPAYGVVSNATRDPADRLVSITAAVIVALAILVLIGWLFDVAALRTIAPMWSAMAPLTTIMLILISAAMHWHERRRTWANAALAGCVAISAALLIELLFDANLGMNAITRALDGRPGAPLPELPDGETATAMLLLVAALLCWRTKSVRLHDFADVMVVFIGLVCLQVLLAYTYHVITTSTWRGFRQIAAHTTISVMILGFASTARRPTLGLFGAMRGEAQSALQLRRLLPATVLFVGIIGWLYMVAVNHRVAAVPDLVAWTVVAAITGLALLLFITSADMRDVEAIVERRQEELIASKMRAEAASEAKSRFMAVMSHELRTPLTAVIGYANLLGESLPGEHPEAKGYVERIRASGWHLVGLIDAVLLYASGQAPADENRPQRVDVSELVAATTRMFERDATRKGLTVRISGDERAWAVADLRKLRQILNNLIENAVKFTDHGYIDTRVQVVGEKVLVEITDTGIGIGADQMTNIWEPFNQADTSHTRTRGGMGLGLAVARKLSEQIGAELSVRSNPAGGSTFTVELPRAERTDARIIELNGARVLVVDDEAGVRRIMVRTLVRYGGQVTQAESAQEALDFITRGDPFDVVVTDISMPGMTGIEMAQRLKAQRIASPILFVTGAELDAEDHSEITRLDARLLRKPFDMVELAKTVQQLAGRG